jgi:hypothetical protein
MWLTRPGYRLDELPELAFADHPHRMAARREPADLHELEPADRPGDL